MNRLHKNTNNFKTNFSTSFKNSFKFHKNFKLQPECSFPFPSKFMSKSWFTVVINSPILHAICSQTHLGYKFTLAHDDNNSKTKMLFSKKKSSPFWFVKNASIDVAKTEFSRFGNCFKAAITISSSRNNLVKA